MACGLLVAAHTAAGALGLTALLLRLDAAFDRVLGRPRLAPAPRLHQRLPNELSQPLARVGTILRLCAVAAGIDRQNAVGTHARSGDRAQPLLGLITDGRRSLHVEPQFHSRGNLVDVLSARPGGAN